MSKCSICRAEKDAAYYQRIKRDSARMELRRARDRAKYAVIKQDAKRLAKYRATKRGRAVQARPQIDDCLSFWLCGG